MAPGAVCVLIGYFDTRDGDGEERQTDEDLYGNDPTPPSRRARPFQHHAAFVPIALPYGPGLISATPEFDISWPPGSPDIS